MAEDAGDKTEAPTPRRRAEAREQGQIARSQDLTIALTMLGVMLTLNSTGSKLVTLLKAFLASMLSEASLSELNTDHAGGSLLQGVYIAFIAVVPALIAVMVIAIVSNLLQVGFFFSTTRIQPNFAALNPVRGINRLFGGGQGAVKLLMNLAKMLLLGLVAYSAIHGRLDSIQKVQTLAFTEIFMLGAQIIYTIVMRVGIAMLILAIIDYAYQRWNHERQLKMTKQEVKDEMRRMDGDPKMKGRRRQMAIAMLRKKLKKDVPTADVVVTNPTEFAVALKYDSKTMHAPRVIAKGQGVIAARIREIAIESGVPILERKPLARALYKLVEVGQEIPEQFYSAVAEILAYVYELSGKSRRQMVNA